MDEKPFWSFCSACCLSRSVTGAFLFSFFWSVCRCHFRLPEVTAFSVSANPAGIPCKNTNNETPQTFWATECASVGRTLPFVVDTKLPLCHKNTNRNTETYCQQTIQKLDMKFLSGEKTLRKEICVTLTWKGTFCSMLANKWFLNELRHLRVILSEEWRWKMEDILGLCCSDFSREVFSPLWKVWWNRTMTFGNSEAAHSSHPLCSNETDTEINICI